MLKGCEGAAFDSVKHPTSGQVSDMSAGQGSKSQISKTNTSDRREVEKQQKHSKLIQDYGISTL